MQRYFIKQEQMNNNTVIINEGDYHHIKNVMRFQVGVNITVCPNNNKAYLGEIVRFGKNSVTVNIIGELPGQPEMPTKVTIASGYTKVGKLEEIARRLAELGAACYIPVMMNRSTAKLGDNQTQKIIRLKKIVKEACEQSRRNVLMEISPVLKFTEFLRLAAAYDLCLVADEREGANNPIAADALRTARSVLVLSGPEGGITDEEIMLLKQSTFTPVGLGPRTLRCETAPLYMMSVIAHALGQ